jgi:hypothetical protein
MNCEYYRLIVSFLQAVVCLPFFHHLTYACFISILGDESFDFGAMGRIFCGLCQVGAWGCFDEFNRLEERILSAVSQQILTIQQGLLERQNQIELLGKSISLHDNVGIFVTMNPGYAGRSNLPDNLKTLFRSVAMVVPDRKLIAQVMLYSQGIVSAEKLAGRVVDLCKCFCVNSLYSTPSPAHPPTIPPNPPPKSSRASTKCQVSHITTSVYEL